MQAMILAAGMGKRLGKYTSKNTKCMVKVGGLTLIEHACNALKQAGVTRLVLVCGYQAENLVNFMRETITGMEITYVLNPDYNETNNIYSLSLAKDYLRQDDTILLESDLIFEPSIIGDLVRCPDKDVVVVAKYQQWMDGTVTLLKNGYVAEFVEKKDFNFDAIDSYYKTVNIYKFSKEFSSQYYIPFLDAYITAYGKNKYYELVLKALSHLSSSGLKALELQNQKWYEIDDAQDLNIAETMFASPEDEMRLYQKRYGGYWRFPGLKDFCYLVNPYFPSEGFLRKLQASLKELITQYPSGQDVIDICCERLFNIDESRAVIGNGAAELIHTLDKIIEGRVTLFTPSFHEYERSLNECSIQYIDNSKYDYQFNLASILEALNDTDAIVIINPDNPSGSFLEKSDMETVLDRAASLNKRVIVDESFVDFAQSGKYYTLLDDSVLDQYRNLIVIKSISKSYGIPGLRLGILASGDIETVKTVKQNLSIWDINSLAEYFMQIMPLYKEEYENACVKLAVQREKFRAELSTLGFLKVYESEANYFLCKITNGMSSTELCSRLLRKHRILIKDLAGKQGFDSAQYVRIAVRDEKDNQALIEALRDY